MESSTSHLGRDAILAGLPASLTRARLTLMLALGNTLAEITRFRAAAVRTAKVA
jgi:hypothetical protein